MPDARILIIEDYAPMRWELSQMLSGAGYICDAPDVFTGLAQKACEGGYDLVLLDLNLPFESGFQICMEVKKKSDIPVLVLTSRDGDSDEILSLELGADDFMVKPFRGAILLARIRALLRRKKPDVEVWENDFFYLYPMEYTVSDKSLSQKILLPRNESKILLHLMKKKGQIVKREELMLALWQSDAFVDENTLTVNVGRLRQTLKKICDEDVIVTVRGVGYLLKTSRHEAGTPL